MSHIIVLMGIVDRGDQENPGNLDHGSDIFIKKKRGPRACPREQTVDGAAEPG